MARKPQTFKVEFTYQTKPEPNDDALTEATLASYIKYMLQGYPPISNVVGVKVKEVSNEDVRRPA